MELFEIDTKKRIDIETSFILSDLEEVFGADNPLNDYVSLALEEYVRTSKRRSEIRKEIIEIANKFGILPQDIPALIKKLKEADRQTEYTTVFTRRGRDIDLHEGEEASNERILPHARAAIRRLVYPLLNELREKRKQLNEQLKIKANEVREDLETQRRRTHQSLIESTEIYTASRIEELDKIGR